ncbi:MAG: hypothetical protein HY905_10910 [Deltaproteobacteria bacterium]|nr:hypothetical protein [Deltaproteobacteria bacterium]
MAAAFLALDCRQDEPSSGQPSSPTPDAGTPDAGPDGLAIGRPNVSPEGIASASSCPPAWNADLGEVPANLEDGETRGFHVELALDATKVTDRRVELALRVSAKWLGASFRRARLYDRDTCFVFFESFWPSADAGEGATTIEAGQSGLRHVIFSNEYGNIPLMLELLAAPWKGSLVHFVIPVPDQLLVPKLDGRPTDGSPSTIDGGGAP